MYRLNNDKLTFIYCGEKVNHPANLALEASNGCKGGFILSVNKSK